MHYILSTLSYLIYHQYDVNLLDEEEKIVFTLIEGKEEDEGLYQKLTFVCDCILSELHIAEDISYPEDPDLNYPNFSIQFKNPVAFIAFMKELKLIELC